MEKLMHVIPSEKYENDAIDYINEFYKYNSKINGEGGLDSYLDNYSGWLKKLEKDRKQIANEKRVPAETYFLVRENDNRIVGMINIRYNLNERLLLNGGHIGYSIRPTERRKGYNKINLYLGLKRLDELNVETALLDCVKSNIGSSKTMLALGAKKYNEIYNEDYGEVVEKYKIDIKNSLEKYKEEYDKKIG
mgnify:FL=1